MAKKKKNSKGFTLIEVLAVIVIVSLVMGIAIPNVLKIIDSSRNSSIVISENNIKKSARYYVKENDNKVIWTRGSNYDIDGETFTCVSKRDLVNKGYMKDKEVNIGKFLEYDYIILKKNKDKSIYSEVIDTENICANRKNVVPIPDTSICTKPVYKPGVQQNIALVDDGRIRVSNNLQVNAGLYQVKLNLVNNEMFWDDGSTDEVVLNCPIRKAVPEVYLTPWGDDSNNLGDKVIKLTSDVAGNITSIKSSSNEVAKGSIASNNGTKEIDINITKYVVRKADTYITINFTPSDNNYNNTSVIYTIGKNEKKKVSIPSDDVCRNVTYNGSNQLLIDEGSINNVGYRFFKTTGIDAGNYEVIAKLNWGYMWDDGTLEDKIVNCYINRATPVLSLSKDRLELIKGISQTVEVFVSPSGLLGNFSGTSSDDYSFSFNNSNNVNNTVVTFVGNNIKEDVVSTITFAPGDDDNYNPTTIDIPINILTNVYKITYDYNYLDGDLYGNLSTNPENFNQSTTTTRSRGVSTDVFAKGGVDLYFTHNSGTAGGVHKGINDNAHPRLTIGNQYTWSVYLKASSNKKLNIGQEEGGRKVVDVTTDWQRFTHTYTATTNANDWHSFTFYVSGDKWNEGDTLYLHSLEFMEADGLNIEVFDLNYGETLGSSVFEPVRDGYSFEGWYTSPVGGTRVNSSTRVPFGDTTYYARWKVKSFSISYDYAGGASVENADKPGSVSFDRGFKITKPAKKGYNFVGWTADSNLSVNSAVYGANMKNIYSLWSSPSTKVNNEYFSSLSSNSSSVKLTANWSPKILKVTLDKNGGSGGTSEIYEKYATDWYSDSNATTSISKVSVPSKSGNEFSGYYLNSTQWIDDNGNIKVGNDATSLDNVVLTAKWTVSAKAVITCLNPVYDGSPKTLAKCDGGSITSGGSRKDVGNQTVTCTGDKSHQSTSKSCGVVKAPVSISCKSLSYTGSPQTIATCSGGAISNATRTDAGSQDVTCTGDANHESGKKSCSIAKINASIVCSNPKWNNTEQVIATCSGGNITSGLKRKAAGNQTVTCTGDKNHNTVTKSCGVSKIDASIACSNPKYNEKSQTIATCSGGNITSGGTRKDAGNQTVTCTGDANHNSVSKSCGIAKVDASITCSNPGYNGSPQTIATCKGGNITSGATRKDSGSQDVVCKGDSNHNDKTVKCSVVASKCIIKYDKNGGSDFKKNTGAVTQSVVYNNNVGDENNTMRDPVGYFGAARNYMHPDGGKEWTCSSGCKSSTYDQKSQYKAQDICNGLTANSGNKTVTLKVNWAYNQVILHYCWHKGRSAKTYDSKNKYTVDVPTEGPSQNSSINADNVCDTGKKHIAYNSSDCKIRNNSCNYEGTNKRNHYCIKKNGDDANNKWGIGKYNGTVIGSDDLCSSSTRFYSTSVYKSLGVDSTLKTTNNVHRYLYVNGY